MKKFLILALCLTLFSACESAPTEEVTFDMPTVTHEEVIEETVASDLLYTNEEYGFSLDFPVIWEGYVVTPFEDVEFVEGPGYYFGFGDSYDQTLIAVSIHTHEEWEELQSFDGPKDTYLGETEEWIFGSSASHDASEEYAEQRMGYQDVFDTFEVL